MKCVSFPSVAFMLCFFTRWKVWRVTYIDIIKQAFYIHCGDTHITSHPLPQSIGSVLYSSDLSRSIHLFPAIKSAAHYRVTVLSRSAHLCLAFQNSSGKPRPPARPTDQWRSRPRGRIAYKRQSFRPSVESSSSGETRHITSEEGRIPGGTSGRTTRLTVLKKRRITQLDGIVSRHIKTFYHYRTKWFCRAIAEVIVYRPLSQHKTLIIIYYVSCTFSHLEKTTGAPHIILTMKILAMGIKWGWPTF
jgi:hypothetical protein